MSISPSQRSTSLERKCFAQVIRHSKSIDLRQTNNKMISEYIDTFYTHRLIYFISGSVFVISVCLSSVCLSVIHFVHSVVKRSRKFTFFGEVTLTLLNSDVN